MAYEFLENAQLYAAIEGRERIADTRFGRAFMRSKKLSKRN